MIGRIKGTLLEKMPPQILVDASGVGYEIDVPMSTLYNLPDVGSEVTLFTHFVVREDAQLLYGFLTKEERSLFRLLIRISGIGPKIALSILSGISTQLLSQAVTTGEAGLLTRIPGVGKKTAERIVLELKGKLDTVVTGTDTGAAGSSSKADIVSALLSLGYSDREAQLAIKGLAADISVNDGIREALKSLSK